MVVFVDSSKTPKNQFITILSHADEPIEEGITLAVLPSASFIYSSSPIDVSRTPHLSQWWSESSRELYDPSKRDSHPVQSKIFTLRSSLHSGVNYTGLFPLLARRISVGEAHWATSSRAHPLQYTGEFSYIPKYWEWYPKPPNRRSLRRSARGKSSHNPRGIITTYCNQCRTEDEEAPFRILKVSEKAKEETWLAALLSCWLGEFVFPGKEANLIRPGIFKVASSMARGKKYCLTVPAKYFEEAEARKLFRSITKFKFHRLALFKGHQEILEDNDQLSDSYVDYFISQRPSYLSSRRGDLSVLEPYSPHRFGRQFGFTQDIPGEIKEDLRTAPLERVMHLWHRCLRINTKSQFLVPSRPPSDAAPCTKDYMDWWAKRSDGFFSSDPSQPNGNIGPSTDETSGIVSTFRGADRAMASHAKKLNEEDGISCSNHGNEVSRNDSDRHWRRRKYKDNVIDGANHEIVMKTTEPFIDVDTPSPFSGGDEQVSLSSLFDSANTESVRALCCLFNDPMVVSAIQELVEDENLDISLSQVGVDSLKEVDKRQSPVDGSPSMSEFSVQGLETFDLATKVIEKPHLEKSNASIPPSGPICNPTKDMVSKDRVWKFMENASQYSSIRSAFTQRISLEVKNQRRADAERRYTLALESEAIEARDSGRAEAELSKVLSKETELRKELELLATQRGKT
uniref:Uncharacterized protein n=1 Tax=Fagus sylvatica TaxID=28930 RepID=A0A2N9I0J9_FAGSY